MIRSAANGNHSVLELKNARKTFGPVVALENGNIDLAPGKIHALVGENGAGKSTLVKILAGLYTPDSGEFLVSGQSVSFRSVADSKAAGISVIYQEPTLFPDLSVAENIFIGRQPKGRLGLISRSAMDKDAEALFSKLGVAIDPERLAEGLSIADQQIIEIAKAISLDAQILVMDEPTAALSGAEVERLFVVARTLRDKGVAILFISHRFDEIFELCDSITVMRDGSYIATHDVDKTEVAEIVKEMVGRDINALYPKEIAEIGEVILDVKNLTRIGEFSDVNLNVRSGEIVGIAGLVGAGRTEVARAIFGIDDYDTGQVTINGKKISAGDPMVTIRAGVGFVPEDRRKQGLVLDLSVTKNVTLTLRKKLARLGIISSKRERNNAAVWSKKLQVKAGSLDIPVSTLSGGNQQKIVLAKWLATEPKLLIVDEPTRGIDVGTKAEVHKLLSDLAQKGLGILMISSELPEVIGMADRIYVMKEGKVTVELLRSEVTPELVMHAATSSREESR
jgi:rhamnose transport system ATP-binding protein